MTISNVAALFTRLLPSRTAQEVKDVLAELGDGPTVRPMKPLEGQLGLCWFPVGDREANIANINLATNPGRSITERLTNAMDAVLELGYEREQRGEGSPREAAEKWFHRPPSGPNSGLYTVDYSKSGLSKHFGVVMLDSGIETAPTVEVIDSGIGIRAEKFSDTILSLNQNNKLTKKYTLGRFGQGGSSTLGFSEYVVIFSRSVDKPAEIAFTVIRKIDPGEEYQEDMYAYLAFKGPGDKPFVPTTQIGGDPLTLYAETKGTYKPPRLTHGTLVRHVGYHMPGLEKGVSSSPGNLYHFLHCSLFDPLFPFILYDYRNSAKPRAEVVAGSRNRLMKRVQEREDAAAEVAEEDGDEVKRMQMRHYRSMEFVHPLGGKEGTIGIEYWVPLGFRKPKQEGGEPQLRSSTNEQFLERNYPIICTQTGQNQGHVSSKLLRDIGLGMVSQHIVVHIDCTRCDKHTRSQIFTATREHLKDTPVINDLLATLSSILKDDPDLQKIEAELTQRLTSGESEKTNEEVKRQITRLLEDAGMVRRAQGPTEQGGGTEEDTTPESEPHENWPTEALPTLPFPEVMKLNIISGSPLKVRLESRALLRIETDAAEDFDLHGLVSIAFTTSGVEVASQTPLKRGRKSWRLRPSQSAKVGDVGTIKVMISKPSGETLSAEAAFEIADKKPPASKTARGDIPDFDVLPIRPDHETWKVMWPGISESENRERLNEVAFAVLDASSKIIVYFSEVFAPFAAQTEKLKTHSPALAETFLINYKVWIGYHAIIQRQQTAALDPSTKVENGPEVRQLLDEERARVAIMQIKQAMEVAKLQQRLAKEAALIGV